MPRNTNISYEKIAHYLSAVGKAVTINDICSAGIVSRNTAYRLLIDPDAKEKGLVDVPTEAKLHGIFAVGQKYPTHYIYADVDTGPIKDAIVKKGQDKLLVAAKNLSSIVEDTPLLDRIDKAVIAALQKHRAEYANDTALLSNFAKPSGSVENYLELLDNAELRAVLLADPAKFRTLILSMFVASFNEESEDV